jgi:anti-sigma factor RsiW
MNDLRNPCEFRLEEISLLAAGCLTDGEERELREHLAACDNCHQRFDEIASTVATLRSAKPAVDAESVHALEQTALHFPSPARGAVSDIRLANLRIALLAAAVLVLVGVLRHVALRPSDRVPVPPTDVVQKPAPHVPPGESTGSPLPTLLALHQAAAESDESLDRLLARFSVQLMSEPVHPQSLWQESLQ